MDELRSLRIFALAAELGSLRKAAVVQGIAPQAASKALAQLEGHLGVRLFHRTTRNMALTDEGRQVLDAAEPALAGLQRMYQVARRSHDEIAGPLRIIGPGSAFRDLLNPILVAFCERHPEVQPDVQLDDRVGNWVVDRVDVGFRLGMGAADGVVARRFLSIPLVICATPGYLQRHGVPSALGDLVSHRCSAFRHPVTGDVLPWYIKVGNGPVRYGVVPTFSTNDEAFELQMVLSGQVLAQLTALAAASHVRAGRLVPVLTQHTSDHLALFLYYGTRSSQPARVRAFIDFAVQWVADHPDIALTMEEMIAAEAGAPTDRPAERRAQG